MQVKSLLKQTCHQGSRFAQGKVECVDTGFIRNKNVNYINISRSIFDLKRQWIFSPFLLCPSFVFMPHSFTVKMILIFI